MKGLAIDRLLWEIAQCHDTSELWRHMRQDPEAFRVSARRAFTENERLLLEVARIVDEILSEDPPEHGLDARTEAWALLEKLRAIVSKAS